MKNIHVEKAPSHLPQLSFPLLPSLSCSLSSCKHFPTKEWKMREALWFHLEQQGFFTEESIATTTKKRSTGEGRIFSERTQQGPFRVCFWESGIRVFWSSLPPVLSSFPALQWHKKARSATLLLAYDRCYITSTKNSPALPTARRKDWREAVSSGGTEASSLPGGAPGAAVDRCGGWGGRPGGP